MDCIRFALRHDAFVTQIADLRGSHSKHSRKNFVRSNFARTPA